MYPEIPALSFISVVLTLVPLTWYLRARNVAAVAIGTWLSMVNLVYAVDALVWAHDADIRVPIWCDISTSLITGSRAALPAACLTICIHLERLASFCETSTPQAKRRRIIFEHLMTFGLPVCYIALHLFVQPSRFDLYYGFGCRPAIYPADATIFLVMVPPLLLTTATFVSAGIAWRHFLVHGVRFYGKRSSVPSLTREMYLRLVGMALLEAVLSAVLTAVVMWGVFSLGLAPMRDPSRNLGKILVWGPEAMSETTRTVLRIEWAMTVIQSTLFFGLFACRMEVIRKGRELIRSFWGSLNWSQRVQKPEASERSSTSLSVSTFGFTEVDLSLVFHSASTPTHYGQSEKWIPLTPPPSRPHPLAGDAPEEVVISAVAPTIVTPELPSHASAVASSHNSLESNFDPSRLAVPPDAWPRTPRSVSHRFFHGYLFSAGYDPKRLESGCLADAEMPIPRLAHVRACSADVFGKPGLCESEKRQAIYVTMASETRRPLRSLFSSS